MDINKLYKSNLKTAEEAVNYIKSNVKYNDLVLTLGAGTVTEIGPMLVK